MREHAALFYERQNSRVAAPCQKIFRTKTSRIHIYTILEAGLRSLFRYIFFFLFLVYLVFSLTRGLSNEKHF